MCTCTCGRVWPPFGGLTAVEYSSCLVVVVTAFRVMFRAVEVQIILTVSFFLLRISDSAFLPVCVNWRPQIQIWASHLLQGRDAHLCCVCIGKKLSPLLYAPACEGVVESILLAYSSSSVQGLLRRWWCGSRSITSIQSQIPGTSNIYYVVLECLRVLVFL